MEAPARARRRVQCPRLGLFPSGHASAIWAILTAVTIGGTWDVGGENEWKIIDFVRHLCTVIADQHRQGGEALTGLIEFVKDWP